MCVIMLKNTWTAEENLFFELAPSFGSLNLAPLGSVVLGSSLNRVRSVLLGVVLRMFWIFVGMSEAVLESFWNCPGIVLGWS